jgi:hypothetical protein
VYDHTIGVLKDAVRNAKLGRDEQLAAIRRLDEQARLLERTATGPSAEAWIVEEQRQSHRYGGRSVFGWEPAPQDGPVPGQAIATARAARSPKGTSFGA